MSLFADEGIFAGADRKEGLGIPYMGSKRRFAKSILDHIIQNNPNAKYLYDLFGGGGSISFEALQRPQFKEVHYNEFNKSIVNLLLKIRDDGITDEFYEWVSREDFENFKTGTCWRSGLIKTCWSFGNNQKDYLYSKDIEEDKRLMHEISVNKCAKSLSEFKKKNMLNIDENILSLDGVRKRRIKIENELTKNIKYSIKIFNIVKKFTDIQKGKNVYGATEHLARLDNLQNLKNLTKMLKITNLSYDQVNITTPLEETIIYLDPPYENTKKYEKTINHKKLKEWIRNSPYKIYISSYNFDGFREVASFEHRSRLSATANNKVTERLFVNK
jgi:16S rRNA G966 N2-methylase RsmD